MQAIGGVNDKIERFVDVCQAHGLACSQGAIVPAANTRNLMLKSEGKVRKF
jgi:predicted ATP-dependent protease